MPRYLDIAEDTDAALDLPTPSPVSSLRQALSPVSLIPNTMQPRLNCLNPSNLTSDRVGSIVTVKHIEVQLANLPTYFGVNEDQQVCMSWNFLINHSPDWRHWSVHTVWTQSKAVLSSGTFEARGVLPTDEPPWLRWRLEWWAGSECPLRYMLSPVRSSICLLISGFRLSY